MTFSKQVTHKIVEHWGLGFTAEESQKALVDDGIKISLHTVYNHRRSLTAQNLIDELIRRQERASLKADADHPELAMKYRSELLKILVPQRIEAVSYSEVEEKVTVNVTENEDEILSKAASILSRKDRFKPIH